MAQKSEQLLQPIYESVIKNLTLNYKICRDYEKLFRWIIPELHTSIPPILLLQNTVMKVLTHPVHAGMEWQAWYEWQW